MSEPFDSLELLAPARDLEVGLAALSHGADAVYIGGPGFGARAAAGNSMADVEKLVKSAHRLRARVFLTLNTIVYDDELEAALNVARQAYEAGVDALIVQDLGLLQAGLPPIEIHASTQCDIRTPQKAALMDALGFSQVVLAREMTLEEIAACRRAMPRARIEFFVHGALCVSYSGRCYLSCAQTSRSANRGECAQPCRLPYDVFDIRGREIVRAKHVLSLKDNDQSANLAALAAAGVSSFKIEGRLKDAEYVKNITAYYRQKLDALIEGSGGRFHAQSAGRTQFFFAPDPQKTFHRDATDYFVNGRRLMIASLDTPKSTGERIGTVLAVSADSPQHLDVRTRKDIANGDGLIYFDAAGRLCGLNVNRAERLSENVVRVFVHEAIMRRSDLRAGVEIRRNKDRAFAKLLSGKSCRRSIAVQFVLKAREGGLELRARALGLEACVEAEFALQRAKDPVRGLASLESALGKTGETEFSFASLEIEGSGFSREQPPFVPVSLLNGLRREVLEALAERISATHPQGTLREPDWERARRAAPLCGLVGFGANAANRSARELLRRLGCEGAPLAFELDRAAADLSKVELMRCRHCVRHVLGICPKTVKGDPAKKEAFKRANGGRLKPLPLILVNDKGRRLVARFDCRACEMTISLIENEAQMQSLVEESALAGTVLSQSSGLLR